MAHYLTAVTCRTIMVLLLRQIYALTVTLTLILSIKLVIVSAHCGTSIRIVSVNLSLNGIQLLLTCLIYSMILTETEEIVILVYVMNESLSLRPYSYIYNSFRK